MEENSQLFLDSNTAIKPLDFENLAEPQDSDKIFFKKLGFMVLTTLLGLATGFGMAFYQQKQSRETQKVTLEVRGEKVEKGKVYGREDDIFQDTAVGIVENKERNEGEGTHRLLREGGESQTAYLTSSVLDLDMFVGHKVQVWGQTFSSRKVGWLMDVGKIKVLD